MAEVQQAKGSTPIRPSTSVTMWVNPTANFSTCVGRRGVRGGAGRQDGYISQPGVCVV